MKQKKLLLFILAVLCAANIHSELKHFLPRSNAVMSILDKKYWFEGDTLINNRRYTLKYSGNTVIRKQNVMRTVTTTLL
ncbi:MAG: hypothetical protein LBG15_08850 [Dysgonamonadaceae bacterium]|jgi:hypothetical protein|nr:hypothetical protein [Dysgonamonadaceae bacterium]